MSPSAFQPDGLFPALCYGLETFQARIQGAEGERLLLLGAKEEARTSIVPAIALAVLEATAELLAWLYDAVVRLATFLLQADSAVALLEVFGAGLRGIAEALDREWPPGLAAAGKVGDSLKQANGALAELDGVQLPSLIPRPETLQQIEDTTFALISARIDPGAEPGSLDALLHNLQASTAAS